MYEHTFEEINHTACYTNYRGKSRDGVNPDVHYTLQLWMITGGEPAIAYQGDDISMTQRYPEVPAYAIKHRFNDGGPEWPGDDRLKWEGYYPHQTPIDPKNPRRGVVVGPTPEEVLPNGWDDVRRFVDSTIADMLLFRRRTALVREALGIRGSFPWQALRSGEYRGKNEAYPRGVKVYWGWDFRHYIGLPDQCFVNTEHDGEFDRDEFIAQAPMAWNTFYHTIKRISKFANDDLYQSRRWHEITDQEFEDILGCIRAIKAGAS